ncbi:MAG TPA: hypothetical protein VFZ33_21710 [Chitinophagaceae bacterium]
MLKVNGQYLDFNGDIEIEKKIKLFEDIETTDGDMSFAFDVELTSHNIAVLEMPFPDSASKNVYHQVQTEVLNNEGQRINIGSIRVERIVGRFASCSFLGGNSNWFVLLNGSMTDLDLSRYDVSLTQSNITNSWANTSGIIFPLIDTGGVVTRAHRGLVTEDFIGCFFIHTLLKEVFRQSGVKIQGELLEDPFFLSLVMAANGRNEDQINSRKAYVEKTTPQVTPGAGQDIITFDNDSTPPFFDGSQDNFDLANNQYVADIKMNVNVSYEFRIDGSSYIGVVAVFIFVNGVSVAGDAAPSATTSNITLTGSHIVNLSAGDILDLRVEEFLATLGHATIEYGTLTITPIFLYENYGLSSVPTDWSKQQFVSNILSMFNTICAYDSFTKTLTINLFNKIKEKPQIDISQFIESSETDYSEFISDYGKLTTLTYQEGNDVDLPEFNIYNYLKSISGNIEVDNDFIEKQSDAVELDFSSPVSYRHPEFGSSMERINFIEMVEGEDGEITSVSDNGGTPRFNISNADEKYIDGGIVRIETDVSSYNGDFRISTVSSSYIEVTGLDYISDASGTAIMLSHSITSDDNVYIFSITKETDASDVMDLGIYSINSSLETTVVIAFFNLMRLGKAIEENYKQGLSFGELNSPFFFQRTLIDKYFGQFGRVLNDPVKQICRSYLPFKVYNQIDFLSPITIRTLDSSNLYYTNLLSGYNNSSRPCSVELIKLP